MTAVLCCAGHKDGCGTCMNAAYEYSLPDHISLAQQYSSHISSSPRVPSHIHTASSYRRSPAACTQGSHNIYLEDTGEGHPGSHSSLHGVADDDNMEDALVRFLHPGLCTAPLLQTRWTCCLAAGSSPSCQFVLKHSLSYGWAPC